MALRTLLCALAGLILCWCAPATAAPSEITSGSGDTNNTTVTSQSLTTSTDIPAGSTIVIGAWVSAVNGTPTLTPSDGTANAYSCSTPQSSGGFGSDVLEVCWSANTAHDVPSSSTIKMSWGGNEAVFLAYVAFSGAAALDVNVNDNASGAPISQATGALGASSEAIVGLASSQYTSGGTWSDSSGWTAVGSHNMTVSSVTAGMDYDIVASNASVTFSPAVTNDSGNAATVVSFRAPASARRTLVGAGQ
jgi:hypothetical protein